MLLLCNPKLPDIKRQPFSYARQLYDSEIQKGHSRADFALWYLDPQFKRLEGWNHRRLIHSHVWSLGWVALKTETAEQSTYSWPLHVLWFPHSTAASTWWLWALGLSLLINKEKAASPFWLSPGGHAVSLLLPRFKRRRPAPISWWEEYQGHITRWEISFQLLLENKVHNLLSPRWEFTPLEDYSI